MSGSNASHPAASAPSFRRLARRLACGAALVLRICAGAADAPAPDGIVDFAGRASGPETSLFDAADRPAIDALNRELRLARLEINRAGDADAQAAAQRRWRTAAARLQEIVSGSPRLMRIDLTAPPVAAVGPHEMPGQSGALLLEVRAPGDGVSYRTAFMDLLVPTEEYNTADVAVAPAGTTYVLLRFGHLPTGRNTLVVRFLPGGEPAVRVPIELSTPTLGRLRLSVLSDDTREPTPAMVQLLWRVDGTTVPPANALDFAPQFDAQGKVTGARHINLPGLATEPFWCVPGPFDMALSPGEWRIGVWRGIEHELVWENVTIRPGESIALALRPRRWADMRRQGWWSGDDHVHSRLLSDEDARRLLSWMKAEDVHLANIAKMGDRRRTYFEQLGFGPAARVTDGEHVLVPGQECPRTNAEFGHLLAMNTTSFIRDVDRYFLYDEVLDEVRAQGGLAGYAHVNSGRYHVHRDMSLNVPRRKVDFAEILQFNRLGTDLYYEFLNLGCKLTASAGSDVPWGGSIGEARVYACLGTEPFSADAWFAAFQRGRTFTTTGPMLEFRVDDALPGDEIAVDGRRTLRVRARAWGDPRRSGPIRLEVVRHGDVIETAASGQSGPDVRLDFTVEAGDGFWIAARAHAADGTSAHSTPVYVVREGLRFWKFEAIETLLARQRARLDEIERMVDDARHGRSAGNLRPHSAYIAQLAAPLLERVAELRRLGADWEALVERERARRAPR